jgi:hypothetical protein
MVIVSVREYHAECAENAVNNLLLDSVFARPGEPIVSISIEPIAFPYSFTFLCLATQSSLYAGKRNRS